MPRETQIGDRERNQRSERGRARIGDGDAHRQIGALAQATDGGSATPAPARIAKAAKPSGLIAGTPRQNMSSSMGGVEGRRARRLAPGDYFLRFPARFRPQPERGEDEEAGEARSSAGGGAPDGGPREQRRDEERADDPASAEKRRRNDPQGQDGEKRESAKHAMRERVDPGLLGWDGDVGRSPAHRRRGRAEAGYG